MNIMTRSSTSLHSGDDLAVSVDVEFLFVELDLLPSEFRKQYSVSHLYDGRDELSVAILAAGSCLEHHSVAGGLRLVHDYA